MSEHKSFIIYKNWRPLVTFLDDKSTGQLFKGLFAFACDGECTDFGDTVLSGIYQTMIQLIAEDDERYKQRCKTNSENGKLGGRPPKESECFSEKPSESERFPKKTNVTQKNPIGDERSGLDRVGLETVTDMTGREMVTDMTGQETDKDMRGQAVGKEKEKGSGEKKEENPENEYLYTAEGVENFRNRKLKALNGS